MSFFLPSVPFCYDATKEEKKPSIMSLVKKMQQIMEHYAVKVGQPVQMYWLLFATKSYPFSHQRIQPHCHFTIDMPIEFEEVKRDKKDKISIDR